MPLLPTGLHPQLFSGIPLGLVTVDRKGLICQINPAAHAISPRLDCQKPWAQLANELFHHQRSDGHEVSMVDGKRLHISTCPLPDKTGQLIILLDLTDSHHLQDMMSHHLRLESMGQLLAAMAHQMRTPLTTSMLQVSNLEWLLASVMTPDIKRTLQMLQTVLTGLENKISDILLFARGNQVLHDILTPQQLQEEVQQFLAESENLQPMQTHCHGEFFTPEKALICNRSTLISCLSNILNNAREVGADAVDITLIDSGDSIDIKVQDNGPGLDSSALTRIIEPFYTTKSTGTGLGLPVVRLIAEAHGGRMQVDSELGQGLCVTITLPLATSLNTSVAEQAV